MMKWILLILLVVFTSLPQADEAYSQAQCDRITQEREVIRSKFRQGYSGFEGDKLNARFKLLFEKLARHCGNPTQSKQGKQSKRTHSRSAGYSSSNNDLLQTRLPTMQLHSDSYSDAAKLEAWSNFYTLPKRCRAKGMKSSDFVWCSEYRGEQKRLFEAQWNKR